MNNSLHYISRENNFGEGFILHIKVFAKAPPGSLFSFMSRLHWINAFFALPTEAGVY
jgi:hypothetical protein